MQLLRRVLASSVRSLVLRDSSAVRSVRQTVLELVQNPYGNPKEPPELLRLRSEVESLRHLPVDRNYYYPDGFVQMLEIVQVNGSRRGSDLASYSLGALAIRVWAASPPVPGLKQTARAPH